MVKSTQQESQGRNPYGLNQLSPEERADALIAKYIEPHPGKPGIAEYRLHVEENGYPVWAIVASLLNREDEKQIAREYQISHEAVEAVRAYYARNREAIDARLAANRSY